MVWKVIKELVEIKRYQRRNEAEQTALLYMILEELKKNGNTKKRSKRN